MIKSGLSYKHILHEPRAYEKVIYLPQIVPRHDRQSTQEAPRILSRFLSTVPLSNSPRHCNAAHSTPLLALRLS